MNEILPTLILRTGFWMLFTGVLIALMLKITKPQNPVIHRFAWICVLLQGVFFGLFTWEIPTPWFESFGVFPQIRNFGTVQSVEDAEVIVFNSVPMRPAATEDFPVSSGAIKNETKTVSLRKTFVLFWISGMFVVIFIRLIVHFHLRSILRNSKVATGAHREQWDRLLESLALRNRRLSFLISKKHGPFTFCDWNFRTSIVVPESLWENLDAEHREGVLRHEIAHYLHGDCRKSFFVHCLFLPQWFNPMSGFAVKRYKETLEWSADRFAFAENENGPKNFAEILLAVDRSRKRFMIHLPSFFGSSIRRRLERLTTPSNPRKENRMKKGLMIATCVFLLLCGLYRLDLKGSDRWKPDAEKIRSAAEILREVYEEAECSLNRVEEISEDDQIAVQCRFLTTSPAYIAPEGFTYANGWRFLSANQHKEEPALDLHGENSEKREKERGQSVMCVSESYTPALYRFLSEKQAGELLNLIQGDSRSSVLQAPKMTLLNGQTGRIADTEQHAFARDNGSPNPEVEIIECGTELKIQAFRSPDGSIRFALCEMCVSEIGEVEEFPMVPGKKDRVLCIPKREMVRTKISANVPKDHTLLLALPVYRKNEDSMLCLLLTPQSLVSGDISRSSPETVKRYPGANLGTIQDEWEKFWFADVPASENVR